MAGCHAVYLPFDYSVLQLKKVVVKTDVSFMPYCPLGVHYPQLFNYGSVVVR